MNILAFWGMLLPIRSANQALLLFLFLSLQLYSFWPHVLKNYVFLISINHENSQPFSVLWITLIGLCDNYTILYLQWCKAKPKQTPSDLLINFNCLMEWLLGYWSHTTSAISWDKFVICCLFLLITPNTLDIYCSPRILISWIRGLDTVLIIKYEGLHLKSEDYLFW